MENPLLYLNFLSHLHAVGMQCTFSDPFFIATELKFTNYAVSQSPCSKAKSTRLAYQLSWPSLTILQSALARPPHYSAHSYNHRTIS